jgi:hypothetical protein
MNWGWQDLVALLLVSAALAYLARKVWRLRARPSSTGCGVGGCGSCPMTSCARPASDPVPLAPPLFPPTGPKTAGR